MDDQMIPREPSASSYLPDASPQSGSVDDRVNVLGVGISAINMSHGLENIRRWVDSGARKYVCVCTVHTVMECQRSEALKKIVNNAGMSTPDGMPLVWLLHLEGRRHVTRVYGPDLMLAAMSHLPATYRHFFYGGLPGVAQKLAETLRDRFPEARIVGTFSPPVGVVQELATDDVAHVINRANADIVWVGLGAPKQDFWVAQMRSRLVAPVLIGVGAAFDFHSGSLRQAPHWMQRAGLEWFFRLIQEPRRLWRRYLVYNSLFVVNVAMQKLRLKSYSLGPN